MKSFGGTHDVIGTWSHICLLLHVWLHEPFASWWNLRATDYCRTGFNVKYLFTFLVV